MLGHSFQTLKQQLCGIGQKPCIPHTLVIVLLSFLLLSSFTSHVFSQTDNPTGVEEPGPQQEQQGGTRPTEETRLENNNYQNGYYIRQIQTPTTQETSKTQETKNDGLSGHNNKKVIKTGIMQQTFLSGQKNSSLGGKKNIAVPTKKSSPNTRGNPTVGNEQITHTQTHINSSNTGLIDIPEDVELSEENTDDTSESDTFSLHDVEEGSTTISGNIDFVSYAKLLFFAPLQTVNLHGISYITDLSLREKEASHYGFGVPTSQYEAINIIKKIGLILHYQIDDVSMQKIAHFVARFPRFRTTFGNIGLSYQSEKTGENNLNHRFLNTKGSEWIVLLLAGMFCCLFFVGSSLINEYIDGLSVSGGILHKLHNWINRYRVIFMPAIMPFLFLFFLRINDLLPETQSWIIRIISFLFIGIIIFIVGLCKDIIYYLIAKTFGYKTTWEIRPLGMFSLLLSGGFFKLWGFLPCPTWGNPVIIDSEKHILSMRFTLIIMLLIAGILRVSAERLTGLRHIFAFGIVYGIITDCCRSYMPIKPSRGIDLYRKSPLSWTISFILVFGLYLWFSFLPNGDAYAIMKGFEIMPRKIFAVGCFFAVILGLCSFVHKKKVVVG